MKGALSLLVLLALLLTGCRGGGPVFKGTHDSQDAAIMERLGEAYPKVSFACTGRTEGSVHTMQDSRGVEFPVWTAAKSKGEFQIMEYYLEEWLAANGFFDSLEAYLEENNYSFEYEDYNHYGRHFRFLLGPLDTGEQAESAARAVSWAKSEYDRLYADFQEETGCEKQLMCFNAGFTLDGEEHFCSLYLSLREDGRWELGYPFDDYLSHLEHCIDNIRNAPNIIPDIE